MKKAQSTIEYALGIAIFGIIIALIGTLIFNKNAIIQNSTTGVQGDGGSVHVNGMSNWDEPDEYDE